MASTGVFLVVLLSLAALPQAPAQPPPQPSGQPVKRPAAAARPTASATFAVRVTDPAGVPAGAVRVTLDGPAQRTATTEGGRIAFENLPPGTYRLRFEREGFVTLEREVIARGGAPIDVRVTLTPAPEPPEAPAAPPAAPSSASSSAPPPPSPSVADSAPVVIDLPAFIEKNFVGRESQKISTLGCTTGATATLLQLKNRLEDHTHAEYDEYLYVIAGQGYTELEKRAQPLGAGDFVMIPRGISHALAATGRNPIVMLSIRPGDRCITAGATR